LQFFFTQAHIELTVGDINLDDIAILQGSQRSTQRCFWADMPHAGTTRGARKAPIGDHGD